MSSPSDLSVNDIVRAFQGQQVGTFAYRGGDQGNVHIPGRVLTIIAHSTLGGTVQINSGDTIPVPANVGFGFSPSGNLENCDIVFGATDMYLVEYVT